jgi:N-acylglucosamine 2-epimerase
LALADEVLENFYVPDKDAILEFVTLDGKFIDTPAGRACVPGHALESLWFLMSMYEQTGETDRTQTCCRLVQRHLELGWDPEYGGLRLALDIDNKEPIFWKNSDYKPWWVQVEALVATAYAYLHTRDELFLTWHRKVQEYALAHYPVPTGEWTQWLDRFGNTTQSAALPVKDPFHLPRGLMYLLGLCERIAKVKVA